MALTVVITNYCRPKNVRRLIDALAMQTVKATFFLWDNSPTQDFYHPRVDWLIRSSRNARCVARWWMASHATTEFVLVHDDDLLPAHADVLAWTLDAATRAAPFASGAAGVILKEGAGYWESRHVGLRAHRVRRDARVDIIKGCFFCCPVAGLATIGYLDLDAEDDIAVSARLGGGVPRPHLVPAKLRASLTRLPEGREARQRRDYHRAAREAARLQFFRVPWSHDLKDR